MNIGIIDADLIGKKKHRFPNLACMKISAYHKEIGNQVSLLFNYDNLDNYDYVYISKVFTDTIVPDQILTLSNVRYGGTGFFYDKAPSLPNEIEHHMPDYHLYDEWVNQQIRNGAKSTEFKYYTDYSIGFLTRGCFRQCEFCVNKNYKQAEQHSPLSEFVDPSRKKICLLDDNFLSHPCWKEMLIKLQATGKKFQFKQGLDERLLTEEKCQILFKSKYDDRYIFAFDDVNDYDLIENKLRLIREYTNTIMKFYVLCAYDRNDKWDYSFWYQDIISVFKRIELLMKYRCYPYLMRFDKYSESPFRGIYITLARWCNQPSFFHKTSFVEFCTYKKSSQKYLDDFLSNNPDFYTKYNKYLHMKFNNIKE